MGLWAFVLNQLRLSLEMRIPLITLITNDLMDRVALMYWLHHCGKCQNSMSKLHLTAFNTLSTVILAHTSTEYTTGKPILKN